MERIAGEPIDAGGVERAMSAWEPRRFASFCNALTWAVAGQTAFRAPSFTERINDKDKGVDISWQEDMTPGALAGNGATTMLGPGTNVFQCKLRNVLASDRRRIIGALKSSLKGELARVSEEVRRTPDRYTLLVNLDLSHADKSALLGAICEGAEGDGTSAVQTVGAAELAAMLNSHPHLRESYFPPRAFGTWEDACDRLRRIAQSASLIDLVGRDKELADLRQVVEDTQVRVVVVAGPSGVGKSRIILEATKDRRHLLAVATDPRSLSIDDYRRLCTGRGEVVCLIEDPDFDRLPGLVNETLGVPGMKALITMPVPRQHDLPSFGFDSRVQVVNLKGLDSQQSRDLLKEADSTLAFDLREWIVDRAGGIPHILLTAAALGEHLRGQKGVDLAVAVGRFLEDKIKRDRGDRGIRALRLFSLLSHAGVAGKYESELSSLCVVFGDGMKPNEALEELGWLVEYGYAERGGSFASVAIPMLADYAASMAFQGQHAQMFALLVKLEQTGGTGRFLRRLLHLGGPDVQKFWDEMFEAEGPLRDLGTALKDPDLVMMVSSAMPSKLLKMIKSGLEKMPLKERLEITADERRALVHALDELLSYRDTAMDAMRMLWRLAEAENENYGNNATGILTACFHHGHPQCALPIEERLKVLREGVKQPETTESMRITVKAAATAMDRHGPMIPLRQPKGYLPYDPVPSMTWDDVRRYWGEIVGILFAIATMKGDEAKEARRALLTVLEFYAVYGDPKDGTERLDDIIGRLKKNAEEWDIARIFSVIAHARKELSEVLKNGKVVAKWRPKVRDAIKRLRIMERGLAQRFDLQLQRWAGSWRSSHEGLEKARDGRLLYEYELDRLAGKALRQPSLLSEDLIRWLVGCEPDAPSRPGTFVFYLGSRDVRGKFQKLFDGLAEIPEAANLFASYCAGRVRGGRMDGDAHLDALSGNGRVSGEAILVATARLPAGERAIDRVCGLIEAGRLKPDAAAWVLSMGGWSEPLADDQFLRLARMIAGPDYARAPSVLQLFDMWRMKKTSAGKELREFIWECLERDLPPANSHNHWTYGHVAAWLMKWDPDRGFRLLERCLARYQWDDEKHWQPIERESGDEFWDKLKEANSGRLYRILLDAAKRDPHLENHLSWKLKNEHRLNQKTDREALVECAAASVEDARLVASWITTGLGWADWRAVAEPVLESFPDDEEVRYHLAGGIEQLNMVRWGPTSEFMESQAKEIEGILAGSPPPKARFAVFMREILARFKPEIAKHIVWEYDTTVQELGSAISDPDSPRYLWAVGRVLKFAPWEEARKLLSVEDIERALPNVDLPAEKRKTLETALRIWRGAGA